MCDSRAVVKQALFVLGVLTAIAATITGVAGLDVHGGPNPLGALALAVASLAFFKGTERA